MLTKIPTFDEIFLEVPDQIRDLLVKCGKTPQSPKWHIEGDVLTHTKIVYNRARKIGNLDLTIAALFHDLGKVETTKPSKNTKGSWNSYGHEFISARLVIKYQKWIRSIGGDLFKIHEIVKLHMRIKLMDEMRPHKQEALRLNRFYEDLLIFTDCDNMKTLSKEELTL